MLELSETPQKDIFLFMFPFVFLSNSKNTFPSKTPFTDFDGVLLSSFVNLNTPHELLNILLFNFLNATTYKRKPTYI